MHELRSLQPVVHVRVAVSQQRPVLQLLLSTQPRLQVLVVMSQ
jgi:hypothetical protein